VLRLRLAIERGTRRRWIGIVIVLLLAILLVLVVLHTLQHMLHGSVIYVCFVVGLFAAMMLKRRLDRSFAPTFVPTDRGPPRPAAVYAGCAINARTHSIPLRL
jgi:protein-S-isoprenylcysteine O-methyltransferase Ste14